MDLGRIFRKETLRLLRPHSPLLHPFGPQRPWPPTAISRPGSLWIGPAAEYDRPLAIGRTPPRAGSTYRSNRKLRDPERHRWFGPEHAGTATRVYQAPWSCWEAPHTALK